MLTLGQLFCFLWVGGKLVLLTVFPPLFDSVLLIAFSQHNIFKYKAYTIIICIVLIIRHY